MGFEQLGKKLAQLGQDTKSGVQKMGESYQVNAKLGDEKKELTKLYAAIGKEAYKRFEAAPLEGLEDEFAAVKTVQENIDRLSEQLGKLKNVVYCSECGKEAARGERFCSGCGAKLPEAEEPVKEKVRKDAKEAAGEAGVILEDLAGKTRSFMGGMADRADAFAKGVASRMGKGKNTEEEDIVDMPWEEEEAPQTCEAEESSAAEEACETCQSGEGAEEETCGTCQAEESSAKEEACGDAEAAPGESGADEEAEAKPGAAAEE